MPIGACSGMLAATCRLTAFAVPKSVLVQLMIARNSFWDDALSPRFLAKWPNGIFRAQEGFEYLIFGAPP